MPDTEEPHLETLIDYTRWKSTVTDQYQFISLRNGEIWLPPKAH